jgi:beta-lactamase regulating signal transducer with metallopeptidase domain
MKKIGINRLGYMIGGLIFLSNISFFLLFEYFNYTNYLWLRISYFIIFFIWFLYGFLLYKKYYIKEINHWSVFYLGYLITASSIFPFIIFIYVYLSFIYPYSLKAISESLIGTSLLLGNTNDQINTSITPMVMFIDYFLWGIFLSFCMVFITQLHEKKLKKNNSNK